MKINWIQKVNGAWYCHTDANSGTIYTDHDGQGLFYQNHFTGNIRQLLGTCQFQACKTASGMKRKIARELSKRWEWQDL